MEQFLEILFATHLQAGDLEIITPATRDAPGRARLKQARLGQPQPGAPHSRPVFSQSGAKIGFVAKGEAESPPYNHTYWLEAS